MALGEPFSDATIWIDCLRILCMLLSGSVVGLMARYGKTLWMEHRNSLAIPSRVPGSKTTQTLLGRTHLAVGVIVLVVAVFYAEIGELGHRFTPVLLIKILGLLEILIGTAYVMTLEK